MDGKRSNLTMMLLLLALFTGATIEIAEGSIYNGIILFFLAAILFTRLNLSNSATHKYSKEYLVIGFLIIIADLIYNLSTKSILGTLDTMTFFLGMSLIAVGFGKQQSQRFGEFGAYLCAVFIALYLIFYTILPRLNIEFIHTFDHYFILLPTVKVLELIGVPVEVIGRETVHFQGVEDTIIMIGGPCSGLYSMFLLMGIVVGYSKIEKLEPKKTLLFLGLSIPIAYIANLFRVVILYLTAYKYGAETMMFVHTHLGWLLFAVIAIFLVSLIDRKKKAKLYLS